MVSRSRRGRQPKPDQALTRQRSVGTVGHPGRGRAIHPARGGHHTRPLNARGSLGNYLRKESPFGLSSAGAAEVGSLRAVDDRIEEDVEAEGLARFGRGEGGETVGLSQGPSEERNGRAAERARDHPKG